MRQRRSPPRREGGWRRRGARRGSLVREAAGPGERPGRLRCADLAERLRRGCCCAAVAAPEELREFPRRPPVAADTKRVHRTDELPALEACKRRPQRPGRRLAGNSLERPPRHLGGLDLPKHPYEQRDLGFRANERKLLAGEYSGRAGRPGSRQHAREPPRRTAHARRVLRGPRDVRFYERKGRARLGVVVGFQLLEGLIDLPRRLSRQCRRNSNKDGQDGKDGKGGRLHAPVDRWRPEGPVSPSSLNAPPSRAVLASHSRLPPSIGESR